MSLHNQDSNNVTSNKTSDSLNFNSSQSSTSVSQVYSHSSMAKQISKNTNVNTVSTSASSNSNKFSTLNINNQFKGKSIEPQHKSTVVRPAHTGMQTLGKAVAARRMPPPAHLPSMRTFNSSPIQSNNEINQSNEALNNGQQNQNSQSSTAPTIAAVVSGSSPWGHDSNLNNSFNETSSNKPTYNRNNSINQEDFPKLDEALQIEQKQNTQPLKSKNDQVNSIPQVELIETNTEPVLKPTNVGNWSTRVAVPSVDEPETLEQAKPSPPPSQSPVSQPYQPPHQRYPNQYNNQYRQNYTQKNSQINSNYRKYNHHYNRENNTEVKSGEEIQVTTRRPYLYNKNDSLQVDNKENANDANKIDYSNLDENNWAMISDRVNYDEKLEFCDDDDDEEESRKDDEKMSDQVELNQDDFEDQIWKDKQKEKEEELIKTLERAKIRRAEDTKRVNEQKNNEINNSQDTSMSSTNRTFNNSTTRPNSSGYKSNYYQTNRNYNQNMNSTNSSSNNNRYNNTNGNNNYQRVNRTDDQPEPGHHSGQRPLSHKSSNYYTNNNNLNRDQSNSYHTQSQTSQESINQSHQSEKNEKPQSYQSNTNHRQNYNNQNYSSQNNSYYNQSNRYHQNNTNSVQSQNRQTTNNNVRYQNQSQQSTKKYETIQNQNQPTQQHENKHQQVTSTQVDQKKSLKQLTQNVPEIESKLQTLGSRKQLPIQTNQNINQTITSQEVKKPETIVTEPSKPQEIQEPKPSAWAIRTQETNHQETQNKNVTKTTIENSKPVNRHPQRSNQRYNRRYDNEYEEDDYEDDYDEYTDEEEEGDKKPKKYPQNDRNRTTSGSVYSNPRRPSGPTHYPQTYKRGTARRSNDYYENDQSKNYYNSYPNNNNNNKYYNNYDYNYNRPYNNYNYRGAPRGSNYQNNKVYYNSGTKSAGTNSTLNVQKDPKEFQNRQRDQTSMTKHSEHTTTDQEMYDEWETASDSSLRHQGKKTDEPKPAVKEQAKVQETQKYQKTSSQRSFNTRKPNQRNDFKNNRNGTNPNDPRYTAKYWSDNSKSNNENSRTSNDQKTYENKAKSFSQQRPQNGQNRVNIQVYRVDNIIVDNPEAIKEALSNQTVKEKSQVRTNPLSGIDLNNRAGVVIVDYIPESGESNTVDENSPDDDEKDDDDGFQKVKTKRDKKAEKMKAAKEAAAAAAAATQAAKKREALKNSKKVSKVELKPKTSAQRASIMSNIQTWKNEMAKPGAKTVAQVVKSGPSNTQNTNKKPAENSASVDLTLKIESCKKVWDNNQQQKNIEKTEAKPVEKEVKPVEVKPKEEVKEVQVVKPESQTQKNVCTVKPTQQMNVPSVTEQKQANLNVTVNTVPNNPGSNVVSPNNTTAQALNENQPINNFYDKMLINQATSSAAVAATAAAAAAAVVAVTVTSIQQQQQLSNPQNSTNLTVEQPEQQGLKSSNSSSSIKNQSSSSSQSNQESQNQQTVELAQIAPVQAPYSYPAVSTNSQTSLISSPSQSNSQLSASSLMHSLNMNQINQPIPPTIFQQFYPHHQLVQPFMSQTRPMPPPQNQSGPNTGLIQPQNKTNLNSLFDFNLSDFNTKDGMLNFYPPPPQQQNYLPPGAIPPQAMPPHIPPPPINTYPNGFDQTQFFNQQLSQQKGLSNKQNPQYPPPPQMAPNNFNTLNSNVISKPQFTNAQNTSNQLVNQIHQYNKQQEFQYFNFNNQQSATQNFNQSQTNQPNPQANNNLGFFQNSFVSQISNLSNNPNQFQQSQPAPPPPQQQSLFSLNQNQLSNNLLFGPGYNLNQQQSSQFGLNNLIQAPQNQQQQQQQQQPNQQSSHRQTPLSSSLSNSMINSPFIANENQQDVFLSQQNGFDSGYKQPSNPQNNFNRNSNLPLNNKQIFPGNFENNLNFDKNQQNKPLNQQQNYYRSMEQPPTQTHYNPSSAPPQQPPLLPPQQQPPLLPNPPLMPNQLQTQNKMNFTKAPNNQSQRYVNTYPNNNLQNRPQQNNSNYYNQGGYNNRRSYPNQGGYQPQNSMKKMPYVDNKINMNQKSNESTTKQVKQESVQSQPMQGQSQNSPVNEDKK